MPALSPIMIKLMGLIFASMLVLSPLSITHHSNEVVVLNEIGTHFEVQIPSKDGEIVTLYIKNSRLEDSILPIDGIFIINKKGEVEQGFDLYLNEDWKSTSELTHQTEFAEFFQQLQKDKKDIIAPWLERAYRNHDGLIKDLKREVVNTKTSKKWFNR